MDDDTAPDDPGRNDPGVEDPGAGVVVAPKPAPQKEEDRPPIPKYNVVLWDSDDHTYEYVEKMMKDLFGYSDQQCLKLAETVDKHGRAIVITTTKEHAELKRDQVHAFGTDLYIKNCKGSMKATIEEVS
ncbi:ATP-dependent Clp protease adaptor [Posidoniimonas polymericola]|uniref:ATP-dependent Clp protease adaptor n=1 Tax=Posidoniimonas polymericola TaxID=2528002 RepID=A0A5C5YHR6_9BACT|nr:ATP-dependent Clp protease adaptor ClpS [Posidoniimonas polymericola]TWT74465.1 ATP-dependent Clp protease adaptor [Posidoniimonas polymericola]